MHFSRRAAQAKQKQQQEELTLQVKTNEDLKLQLSNLHKQLLDETHNKDTALENCSYLRKNIKNVFIILSVANYFMQFLIIMFYFLLYK